MTRNTSVAVAPLPVPKKPMARAHRVTLFEREVRTRLSSAAIELLLARARVLSEGRRAPAPRAGYFGSTMLTIDVGALADVARDAGEHDAAERIAALARDDRRLVARARALALGEATRIAGGPLAARATEVRVRAQGALVYLDIDVEE